MMGSILRSLQLSPKVRELLKREGQYIVGGVEPLPGFFVKGQGAKLWDVDGKEYLDFIMGFSCTNQGHCHPYITQKVCEQLQTLALVNISSHNPQYSEFAEMMCKRFKYDKIVAQVTGSEAADAACKTARKWGIMKKGIPAEECLVLAVGASYHGMLSGVWNLQDPSQKRREYGLDSRIHMNFNPSTGESLAYLDLERMERCLTEHHKRVAAVIMEIFHGVAKDVLLEEGTYGRGVYDLCKKYNILFIADEVRSGAGKTGKFFSYMHLGEDCKPDVVTMGKSITGGQYPQSFIMGTEEVMSMIGTNETSGTFAYTPMAITAATAAIQVIDSENLMQRATKLGYLWKSTLDSWRHPLIEHVSSIGADSCVFVKNVSSTRIGALALHKGLLLFAAGPRLRISLCMTMTDEDLLRGAAMLKEAFDEIDQFDQIEGEIWHQYR